MYKVSGGMAMQDRMKSNSTYEKIVKTNSMIRDIMPYSNKNMGNVFTGAEAVLNILENIYGINHGIYKQKAQTMMSFDIPNKHIRILEAAVPYLGEKKQNNVNKFLTLNNQIVSLRNNKNANIIEKGKNIVEILDTANVKKVREMKQKVNMIKTLMKLI